MTKNADTKFGSLSWVEITTDSIASPSSRSGHSLTYFEGSLYLFGGEDDYSASNELWQYHIDARVWTKLTCSGPTPPRLYNHTTILYDRKIFVFGGSFASNFALWVFDFDIYEWSVYHGNETWPKNRHSQSVALLNNHAYMYGGYTFLGSESDELWSYDLDENEWRELAFGEGICKPTPMFGHTAVFNGPVMWLFGGSYLREVQQSLWALDTESWSWKEVIRTFSPPSLYYHIAIVSGDIMLIYGGMDESIQRYTGMWRFNFETEEWTQMVSTELPPLSGHAVAVSYVKSINTEQMNDTLGMGTTIQYSNRTQQTALCDNETRVVTTLVHSDTRVVVHSDITMTTRHSEQNNGAEQAEHTLIEMFPVTPGDIELRPLTTQSTLSKSSTDSHYSLPGMVDTPLTPAPDTPAVDDPWDPVPVPSDSCGSPPQRIHHAVYTNKSVTQQPGFCVNNPLYNEDTALDNGSRVQHNGSSRNGRVQHGSRNGRVQQHSIRNGSSTREQEVKEHENKITFYDKTVLSDNKLEHNSDSGSQGSRSSLRKKKNFKRGCKTEFFIVGHGQDALPVSSVLYRCKIGL